MRTSLYTALLGIILLASPLVAEESGCPAQKAAEAGFQAYDNFHDVISPLWHDAWPDKNYGQLIEASGDMQKAGKAIKAMSPAIGNTKRAELFKNYRKELLDYVKEYAKAAKNNDSVKVYEIMPDLHDAFENGASSLIPVEYPELNGIMIVSNSILKRHLPAKNMEGITGSTETLMEQIKTLMKNPVPGDVGAEESQVKKDFKKLSQLVADMKECCDKKEMDKFEEHAIAMHQKLANMIKTYL